VFLWEDGLVVFERFQVSDHFRVPGLLQWQALFEGCGYAIGLSRYVACGSSL
jgi:hypothetical protein